MAKIPLSENDNGRKIIIVLGVFLVLDYIFVFIRYWARYLRRRNLEFNDWTMLAALVSRIFASTQPSKQLGINFW